VTVFGKNSKLLRHGPDLFHIDFLGSGSRPALDLGKDGFPG
jgi:hypothetical protein